MVVIDDSVDTKRGRLAVHDTTLIAVGREQATRSSGNQVRLEHTLLTPRSSGTSRCLFTAYMCCLESEKNSAGVSVIQQISRNALASGCL